MDCMVKLLAALAECGEAAMVYRGHRIVWANGPFAALFERTVDECEGLEIVELCHNESIEMIRDFMHRRALGDQDVPCTYSAAFRTASKQRMMLTLTVVKLAKMHDSVLVIVHE